MIAAVVVVIDEPVDAAFKIARQVSVIECFETDGGVN